MNSQAVSEHVILLDAPYQGKYGVLASYLVKGGRSLLVDPGSTPSSIYLLNYLKKIETIDETFCYVAPTHIHLDHAGGSWNILKDFPYTKLLVHPRGASHMIDPTKLEAGARSLFGDAVSSYGKIRGVPPETVEASQDGQEIDLEGISIRVIWTPGHASHHQSFFEPKDRVLILGDAGGFYLSNLDVIMPTTPPPFNPIQYMESLDKLISLEPNVLCFGHFGFTGNAVNRLKAHKTQIQLWNNIVSESVDEGLGNEVIYEKIRKQDPMAEKIPYSPIMTERSPLINVLGFVNYHKWIRSRKS